MTGDAWGFAGVAIVAAVADWVAVSRRARLQRLEYIAKPAATLAIIGIATALVPVDAAQRAWFVAGLALCLAGDVFLMLPRDAFAPGLGSFLVAHIAFIVGLCLRLSAPGHLAVSGPIVAVVAVALGARLIRGARAGGHAELTVPLVAYVAVISTVASLALATGNVWAGTGAVLFMVSDAANGWARFVGPILGGDLTVMITYHLALIGLVVSLAR